MSVSKKELLIYTKKLSALVNLLALLLLFVSVVITGVLLNTYAINQNGKRMPVYTKEFNISDNTHFSFTDKEEINNFYLVDIFKLNLNKYIYYYSIGDVFLFFGQFVYFILAGIIVFCAIKLSRQNKKIKKEILRNRIKGGLEIWK